MPRLSRRAAVAGLAASLAAPALGQGGAPEDWAARVLDAARALPQLRSVLVAVDGETVVAEAVRGTGLDPTRVHQITGGNPFYVSQVAVEPDRPLPSSVRDAVLARVARVEPQDLEVLQLIACSPDRLDDRVLPLVGVELDTLRRLDETTLLTHTDNGWRLAT